MKSLKMFFTFCLLHCMAIGFAGDKSNQTATLWRYLSNSPHEQHVNCDYLKNLSSAEYQELDQRSKQSGYDSVLHYVIGTKKFGSSSHVHVASSCAYNAEILQSLLVAYERIKKEENSSYQKKRDLYLSGLISYTAQVGQDNAMSFLLQAGVHPMIGSLKSKSSSTASMRIIQNEQWRFENMCSPTFGKDVSNLPMVPSEHDACLSPKPGSSPKDGDLLLTKRFAQQRKRQIEKR